MGYVAPLAALESTRLFEFRKKLAMTSHTENFAKALDWTGKLRTRYLHTLATFRIYERFRRRSAPNIVGKKKAEANARIFNQNIYFFAPLQEAARCYFFLELAKFFDTNKNKQSLTIELLLDFVDNHFSSFSKEKFLEHHSTRHFLPDLFADYKPFSKGDIKKIRDRLKRNKKVIANLKIYRDKALVHADLKYSEVPITGSQIKVLLRIIKDTVDLYYQKLDFAMNDYRNYDKEPAFAVDHVMQSLLEHEQERIQKIYEKYGK